ncbi:uncharacterized protein BO66DRAFT_191246 [Aspergillus aculeatinus CBS 121060]|uniref:Uncharacterized protein n=1 Tax=Aspergillus aculeatinus CBS 121060 TaxID=1448322 RepID=A0ACD1GX84_9EURO|nr:hypothetical protein BO66DRAFT_191246 [Aspergillus aculeatinus CBS 121060]RAH65949.1 hypothetical protein BO66DRAFT_191246 [Aspergillus aculeatinus CBS 121060]
MVAPVVSPSQVEWRLSARNVRDCRCFRWLFPVNRTSVKHLRLRSIVGLSSWARRHLTSPTPLTVEIKGDSKLVVVVVVVATVPTTSVQFYPPLSARA